jgi:hypothetical protein
VVVERSGGVAKRCRTLGLAVASVGACGDGLAAGIWPLQATDIAMAAARTDDRSMPNLAFALPMRGIPQVSARQSTGRPGEASRVRDTGQDYTFVDEPLPDGFALNRRRLGSLGRSAGQVDDLVAVLAFDERHPHALAQASRGKEI